MQILKKINIIPKFFAGMLIACSIILGAYAEEMMVYKVTDGDTIKFVDSNYKIINCRMAYIDAPESSNNPKMRRDIVNCNITMDNAKKIGKLSTIYTTTYFTKLKERNIPINVNITGRDIKNNRMVCEVELFNYNIIKDGYALPYISYIPKAKRNDFIYLKQLAQANKLGLWKDYPTYMECLANK